MSAAQIRFLTLSRREVNRFMKIKKQTIGAPLLETFLYISVFGAALGTRINELHGFKYVVFVIPGLIMMAWAMNSFSNNASSILQQKFQGAIQDQLSSPASPAELLLAFSLGGFMRGLIVAVLTFIASALLVDLPVEHVLVLIPSLFLVGFFFSQLGVLIGVRAEQIFERRLQAHRLVARRRDRQIFEVAAAGRILAGDDDAAPGPAIERQLLAVEDAEHLVSRHRDAAAVRDGDQPVAVARSRHLLQDAMDVRAAADAAVELVDDDGAAAGHDAVDVDEAIIAEVAAQPRQLGRVRDEGRQLIGRHG